MNRNIVPVSCTNLSQYLATVKAIPVLTLEEEQELVADLSNQSKQVLAYHHLKLVVAIAYRFTTKDFNDLGDIIQAGNMGLLKGIEKFNGVHGVRVSTYVAFHIRNEICDWIVCNWSPVKIATTKDQRKIFFNMSKARKAITEQECIDMAKMLNVDLKELKEMQKRMAGRHGNLSFESSAEEDEEGFAKFDQLDKVLMDHSEVDLQSENALTVIANQQREQLVHKAIAELNERQRDIITQRYLSDEPKTLTELAATYGVSQQRVSQIEKDALKHLQTKLASIGLEFC